MRILANENFPGPIVFALRHDGHDVSWIYECAPGSSDPDVLKLATSEGRVVATRDKDFGALVFRAALPAPYGIILVRHPGKLRHMLSDVIAALRSDHSWPGQMTTIEPGRVRSRALPRG